MNLYTDHSGVNDHIVNPKAGSLIILISFFLKKHALSIFEKQWMDLSR